MSKRKYPLPKKYRKNPQKWNLTLQTGIYFFISANIIFHKSKNAYMYNATYKRLTN